MRLTTSASTADRFHIRGLPCHKRVGRLRCFLYLSRHSLGLCTLCASLSLDLGLARTSWELNRGGFRGHTLPCHVALLGLEQGRGFQGSGASCDLRGCVEAVLRAVFSCIGVKLLHANRLLRHAFL